MPCPFTESAHLSSALQMHNPTHMRTDAPRFPGSIHMHTPHAPCLPWPSCSCPVCANLCRAFVCLFFIDQQANKARRITPTLVSTSSAGGSATVSSSKRITPTLISTASDVRLHCVVLRRTLHSRHTRPPCSAGNLQRIVLSQAWIRGEVYRSRPL